ncbi:MAG: histidine phosphatase family protein [Lachnospiraceae bacterium]|nr:histidine phosphatase family protein [Lachnospiraceae bacterium]
MLLFYVRHGDPIYSPDSLTDLGKRQAEAVAKRLAAHGIDRIFASTSNRAILTAKPTSEITKKEIELLDFCNEGHVWNEFTTLNEEGRKNWAFADNTMRKLFVSREVRELGDKWYEHPAFQGTKFREGVERVNREVDQLFLSLGYEHIREESIYKAVRPTDERVAIFAHQGFGMSFLSSVLDIPYPQISMHFDMGHTGMTVIDFRETDGMVVPKVLMVSNDSHIYREGLPTQYLPGTWI